MTAEQKSALAGVVTIDKEVMHGTPCFAHKRVPVQTLIDFLETGETIDDFLAVYPFHSSATRFFIPRLSDLGWQHLQDHVLLKQLECEVLITPPIGDSRTSIISSHCRSASSSFM